LLPGGLLVASDLLLGYPEHLLVVLHEQVEAVPLELIQRPVEAVVVLDLVLEVSLEEGLGLPGCLAVGKTPPLDEVELVDVVLVCYRQFDVFLCQRRVVL